jgi:hypothetical protein
MSQHDPTERETEVPPRVQEVDWERLFPFLRLFGSFRLAIDPWRLLLALAFVAALYLGGRFLDVAFWQQSVYPKELQRFATMSPDAFDGWVTRQKTQRAERLEAIEEEYTERIASAKKRHSKKNEKPQKKNPNKEADGDASTAGGSAQQEKQHAEAKQKTGPSLAERLQELDAAREEELSAVRSDTRPRGVFATLFSFKLDALRRLADATLRLRPGLAQLQGAPRAPNTLVGALDDLVITAPKWLWSRHPGFLAVAGLGALALWGFFGGVLSRSAVVAAATGESPGLRDAIRYGAVNWVWFVSTVLIPLVLTALTALCLAVGGLLYNASVLDILASLVFGLALLGGFLAALLLIGLVAGFGLLQPAMAAEGTDAFDAISRAYNYVFGRAWRWLFYNAVALVYGVLTFLFVGLLAFVTLRFTHLFVNVFVWAEAAGGGGRFETIWPAPALGDLSHPIAWGELNGSGRVAAALLAVWVYGVVGLVAAYAVSYFYAAQSWIYLLLRRVADGTEFDDVYLEGSEEEEIPSFEETAGEASEASQSEPPASDGSAEGQEGPSEGGAGGDDRPGA